MDALKTAAGTLIFHVVMGSYVQHCIGSKFYSFLPKIKFLFSFYKHRWSHGVLYCIFWCNTFSMSIILSTRYCVINRVYCLYGAVWYTNLALSSTFMIAFSMNPKCSYLSCVCRLMGCRKSLSDWIWISCNHDYPWYRSLVVYVHFYLNRLHSLFHCRSMISAWFQIRNSVFSFF